MLLKHSLLKLPVFTFLLTYCVQVMAQPYPPAAGLAGSNAMHKDSLAFVNWANTCTVTRGYQDIATPTLGLSNAGDAGKATGKAQINEVVSLGDGGIAVCLFPLPIRNGNGPDFAVFENSFSDSFLELAFVEVSSDGVNFFRFPSHSLTDTLTQVDSFGAIDPSKINNLAGKYRGGFGTPFDIADLPDNPLLNKEAITHVKVIDVVGSMSNPYASRDSYNRKINDPWPTPFGSGGFDLDAIGVINQNMLTAGNLENEANTLRFILFPNPAGLTDYVSVQTESEVLRITIYDSAGNLIHSQSDKVVNTSNFKPGIYSVNIHVASTTVSRRLIISR